MDMLLYLQNLLSIETLISLLKRCSYGCQVDHQVFHVLNFLRSEIARKWVVPGGDLSADLRDIKFQRYDQLIGSASVHQGGGSFASLPEVSLLLLQVRGLSEIGLPTLHITSNGHP